MQRDIDAGVPLFLRREYPYPCETHGNPAELTARALAWLGLFELVAEYSDARAYEDPKRKGKTRIYRILNVQAIKIICDEAEIDCMTAIEMLSKINRVFCEA